MTFDQRQSNDYDEVGLIDQKEAERAILEAQDFVDKIAEYFDALMK